jgi:hypothetical protein
MNECNPGPNGYQGVYEANYKELLQLPVGGKKK